MLCVLLLAKGEKMRCPYCVHTETKVLDSRESPNTAIRRRRECTQCSKRFTTYERLELLELSIVKRDDTKEQFSRDKLVKGMRRACEKRPVTGEQINQSADAIEAALRSMDTTEIPAHKIGELVIEHLKHLDDVAYIRFASVYRQFGDVKEFADEIKRLKQAKKQPVEMIAKIKEE